ncbi:MAG: hypothetical protein HKM02_09055 [Pseudomonadales bacterium]|nr:hypothetical protein [Pseudomonadales bacterium]
MIVPSVGIDTLYKAAAEYAYELTSRFKGVRIVSLASIDPSLHKKAYESLLLAGVSSFIEGHAEFFMPNVQHLGMRLDDLFELPGTLSIPLDGLGGMLDILHKNNKFIVRDIYNSMSMFGLDLILPKEGSMYLANRLNKQNLFIPHQFDSELPLFLN